MGALVPAYQAPPAPEDFLIVALVVAQIVALSMEEPMFPMRNSEISDCLRAVFPEKDYTVHSKRRGSLQTLLFRGATVEDLVAYGRYKSERGLFRYLAMSKMPRLARLTCQRFCTDRSGRGTC